MKMTASEKIARVFEIVGYLWLAPSIIGFGYSVLISVALMLGGSAAGFGLSLIPLAIFGAGVFLLAQYYRHSRGLLDDDLTIPLWAATLVFNFLLLVPFAYGFFVIFNPIFNYSTSLSGWQRIVAYGWGLATFWLAAAVLLSIAAIISELWNQKYR